jgi:ABC-type transport system involved in multi-copper enzyme maturation permease subunit
MKQVLAILQKDVRRSRAPLAISLALTTALAIVTPRYVPMYTHDSQSLNRAIDILQMLLPLIWWAVVAHVVYGEPLAGDRQFWLTRPYSRWRLFAAKLLFCAAFLLGPFLVADLAIVAAMRFSPMTLFPQLVQRQLALGGTILIPAFVLAALTRSMRQFILTLLGSGVAFTLLIPIVGTQPGNAVLNHLQPASRLQAWFDQWSFTLWCAVTLGFLLWMYAARRVAIARAVVAGVAVLAFASIAMPSRAFVPVPSTPRHPEIEVAFAPQRRVTARGYPSKTQIDLPVDLTGRARDLLDWQLGMITITPADGPAWTSRWNYSVASARNEHEEAIELYFDPTDYDRLSRGPVRVDAILGVTVYDLVKTVPVRHMYEWIDVPGIGKVQLTDAPGSMTYFWWRTPLAYPAEKLVYRLPGARHSWSGGDVAQPFHISPVVSWGSPIALAQGTPALPAEIDVERETDFIRRELTIPSVRLSDFVVK